MIKSLRDVIYTHMLWSIYYMYFRSRLKCDITFWGRDYKNISATGKGDSIN